MERWVRGRFAPRKHLYAVLLKVASYLPDRQLRHLEEELLKEGGLREIMTLARINQRNKRLK